jgi:S1-C subfamily serine protease
VNNLSEYGERSIRSSSALLVLIFIAGLIVGGIVPYYIFYRQVSSLRNDVSILKTQISQLSGNQTINYQNITIYQNSTALAELYEIVKDSVVLIRGETSAGAIQGSGFVYNFSGTMVVITNNHVVDGTTSISVTFSDGDGYAATVNGTDPYADLAVLTVNAPQYEFKPIEIVSSSTLRVGDPVIAIGNPYGLVGSLTTGAISALGRTITEDTAGGFAIANIIQTSALINPGNSGGPLLSYFGKVVGITTAIVADSQGLGFAIPSNTIRREIESLVSFGTYDGHSYLGVRGTDMTYETAQQLGVNVTYGWLVSTVVSGGPSDGKLQANDVIIALNGTRRIKNGDDLASYLEENTTPAQNLTITVVRGTITENVTVTLGRRPSPSA